MSELILAHWLMPIAFKNRAPDAPAAAYLLAIQRRPKEVMEAVAR